jgi:hypothetical protein
MHNRSKKVVSRRLVPMSNLLVIIAKRIKTNAAGSVWQTKLEKAETHGAILARWKISSIN